MHSSIEAPAGADRDIDIARYRESSREQERLAHLLRLIPGNGGAALDIGARDGYYSLHLAERFDAVTALDLECPRIHHPSVSNVRGDACALGFPDRSFDFVLCAEVLEHIPAARLPDACAEIARVAAGRVLIGVPYRQDTRVGRTTCGRCGGRNPPWGHVNVFGRKRLEGLFPGLRVEKMGFAGSARDRTNPLSCLLMDLAGNPWGTYDQAEPCIHCGARLSAPGRRGMLRRLLGFAGHRIQGLQALFAAPRPIWIHVLFSKTGVPETGARRSS